MNDFLPSGLLTLDELAQVVTADVIAPAAEQIDHDALWPAAGMEALASSGLTALTAPQAAGGHGQGLLGMAVITETIGKACASTAMCFGMHCVGTAVIAAKATEAQLNRYLVPIARGRHLTTLALSEAGTGAHFFLPQTSLERVDQNYMATGQKQFVTNGAHADSYVISTQATSQAVDGEFNCLVVDAQAPGIQWGDAWHGLGMRGNSSRTMTLGGVILPAGNLLGDEGDQVWYVFEVVAPYFLMAMAGAYLGVAQAALDLTLQHLKGRRHVHSGQSLADVDLLQHRVGQMWTTVEKTRLLVRHAARLGDEGSANALTSILAAKADAAHTVVAITNEALTLCGGMAYRENSVLARLLRDARASHVMSPTTDLLTLWTGRSALGLSLF